MTQVLVMPIIFGKVGSGCVRYVNSRGGGRHGGEKTPEIIEEPSRMSLPGSYTAAVKS